VVVTSVIAIISTLMIPTAVATLLLLHCALTLDARFPRRRVLAKRCVI
jgi:hypothetical protein